MKTGPRKGDAAPMAIIELVEELTVIETPAKATKRTARKAAQQDKVAALAGDTDEPAAPTGSSSSATSIDVVPTSDEETKG